MTASCWLVRSRCTTLIASIVAGLMVSAPAPASEQRCASFAGAKVRFVVPNKAGGGYDAYSRLLQPFFAERLGATVVIDNKPQAGGIVGAVEICRAAPDGRTIGIINASGLLAAGLDKSVPDPATDFTIIGRAVSNHSVMLTGRNSGIGSLEELLNVAKKRPLVIGVRDAGSSSLFAIPVVASLLGMDYELVTGYVGSTSRVLAAIRGEVDLLVQNFDSTRRFIEDGELRPLLQLTEIPSEGVQADYYSLLSQVPVLTGENGFARRIAEDAGKSGEQAQQQAAALAVFISAGRLIVAPPGMKPDARRCLEDTFSSVMNSTGLRAAARRAKLRIEPADAVAARADIGIAVKSMAEFGPMVRAAMQRARQ